MRFEKLSEGVYTGCSIPFPDGNQIVFGESSKKGTPYARINLGITEGEQSGHSIYHDLYLTDATIEKTVKALRSLGFKGDQFADFLKQRPCDGVQFEVVHEEYNGKTQAKVKWIGVAPKVLAPSDLDALSGKFSGLLTATTPPDESGDPDDQLKF
jgi:hypothetical protein